METEKNIDNERPLKRKNIFPITEEEAIEIARKYIKKEYPKIKEENRLLYQSIEFEIPELIEIKNIKYWKIKTIDERVCLVDINTGEYKYIGLEKEK